MFRREFKEVILYIYVSKHAIYITFVIKVQVSSRNGEKFLNKRKIFLKKDEAYHIDMLNKRNCLFVIECSKKLRGISSKKRTKKLGFHTQHGKPSFS